MKNMKKLTALLLALVMVFALSVSAFAATTSTATLQVNYYGEALLNPSSVTFTITSGMTAKDVLTQYASSLTPTWKTVENLNPNLATPHMQSTQLMALAAIRLVLTPALPRSSGVPHIPAMALSTRKLLTAKRSITSSTLAKIGNLR